MLRALRGGIACLLVGGCLGPVDAVAGDPSPDANGLVVALDVADRVMPAIYKAYGMPDAFPGQWAARATLTNTGKAALRDVRVRFRLEGYAEWGEWVRTPELAPGASGQATYHPILSSKIARIRSSTPVPLRCEWAYEGPGGTREGSATEPALFLGAHEFVFTTTPVALRDVDFAAGFSNAPFLAAWVSRDDPVVKQFAAMANRNAEGAGAQADEESARQVVQACYELMLYNDFSYKSPPVVVEKGKSFDPTSVQDVKFPRDVIRDKSGTCIDLAILLASMFHTLGLRAYLSIVPGHCMPLVALDGDAKKVIAVEATGIRGGLGAGRIYSFEEAVALGTETVRARKARGEFLLIDLETIWANGLGNPEMEPLPPDVLATWGVSASGTTGGLLPRGVAPRVDRDPAGFAGDWAGAMQVKGEDGRVVPRDVVLRVEARGNARYKLFFTADVEVPGDAGPRRARVEERMVGEDQNGVLIFQGMNKAVVDAAGETRVEIEVGRGAAKVQGGRLVGKYGSDKDGFSRFTLEKK